MGDRLILLLVTLTHKNGKTDGDLSDVTNPMDVVTNVTSHSTIPTETGNAVALTTMFLMTTTDTVTIMVTDMVIIMSDITDMVTDIITDQKTEQILTIQLIENVAMMVKRMLTEESFITEVKRSTKRE